MCAYSSILTSGSLRYDFPVSGVLTTAKFYSTRYGSLIKSRQTFLLAFTGLAGYLCDPITPIGWQRIIGLAGSLLFTIGGSTVMNMLIDRDIDRKMTRTNQRPLPTGQIGVMQAKVIGVALIVAGLSWSLWLSPLYFCIVSIGLAVDVLIYSLWLKRITPWSILCGGIAGGMPALAGRALASGHIDSLGILLALVVVCWIPGHNLSLDMLYAEDYSRAGIPTAVNMYGPSISYAIITLSSVLVAALSILASSRLGIGGAILGLVGGASLGTLTLAGYAWRARTSPINLALYKYVSLYLLGLMVVFALNGII